MILCFSVVAIKAPARLFAAESSSGTIAVTGTVPPKPSDLQTSLSVTPKNDLIEQDATLTYTLDYTSKSSSGIPITLQARWGKGIIAGASEPSVESLTYVVDSASSGYGNVPPIIDTIHRTITWSIPSLPANLGTQKVSFQLRTTSTYTGPLKVELPVRASVLSPIGVPDRFASSKYQYLTRATETAALSSPSPTPSASPLTTGTAAASKPVFHSILIKAIGKTSAKVSTESDIPTTITVRYGSSPQSLENKISGSDDTSQQILFLSNLAPATQYYFQVTAGETTSDIFTFKTASQESLENSRIPNEVTISQQRSVLYSGLTNAANGEETTPLSIVKDTVLDLNLSVPNSKEIKTVEVVIRPSSVLGASTNQINTDDLQSTTTVMVQISPDLYVGKVRSPVLAGQYEMISRIEDIYGNLSEEEIGTMKVVPPFTILDQRTGEPIEHAQVVLSIFNQKTQLYEHLSNVTTAIENPAFSDIHGIVDLNLFPGKYSAEVRARGYKTQTVSFEIGNQSEQNLPTVKLEPALPLFIRQFDAVIGNFMQGALAQLNMVRTLSQSPKTYALIVIISFLEMSTLLILTVVTLHEPTWNPVKWFYLSHRHWLAETCILIGWQVIQFFGQLFLFASLLCGYFFLQPFGVLAGSLVLLFACSSILMWTFSLVTLRRRFYFSLKSSN